MDIARRLILARSDRKSGRAIERIAGQRAAVAAWRSALTDLGTVVSGLGDSLRRYRGSLDTLGSQVAELHAEASQLERRADAALGD